MKLVDILARELKEWPEDAQTAIQDADADSVIWYQALGHPSLYFESGAWEGGDYFHLLISQPSRLSSDHSESMVTRAQWQAAVDALKAENCAHLWVGWSDTEACELCNKTRKIYVDWDGSGSPPIGALVQDHSDIGGPIYMAEVVSVEDRLVAIKRHGSLKVVDAHALRPVRTPEQIAAGERLAAIKDMVKALDMESACTAEYIRCGLIYDAGYRKQKDT